MKNQNCSNHKPVNFLVKTPTMDCSGDYQIEVSCCRNCEPARYETINTLHSKVGRSYPSKAQGKKMDSLLDVGQLFDYGYIPSREEKVENNRVEEMANFLLSHTKWDEGTLRRLDIKTLEETYKNEICLNMGKL
jgi:hypothetical protein